MRRLLLAVPALLLALGGAAACGDDGSGGIATAGETSENGGNGGAGEAPLSDEEQGQAFAQCMRDNGIDMADPDPDGGGGMAGLHRGDVDRDELAAALDACRDQIPEGFGPHQELDQETLDRMGEFAECMRDNGYDLPDPNPNGMPMFDPEAFNPDDPDFQLALEACEELLTALRGGDQ